MTIHFHNHAPGVSHAEDHDHENITGYAHSPINADLLAALRRLGRAYGIDETSIRLLVIEQHEAWEEAVAAIDKAEKALMEEACPVCDRTDDHDIGECLDCEKEN